VSADSKAVFLSYASADLAIAQRIADALRLAGVEVWFDKRELHGGDAWDQEIRRQIRTCRLFLPIISANTEARPEAYFRLEWRLAVERMQLQSDTVAFLVPIAVDVLPEQDADVPDAFRGVQWERLAGGQPSADFVRRIKSLLDGDDRGRRAGLASEPERHAPAARRRSRGRPLLAVAAVVALLGGGWLALGRFAPQTTSPAIAAPERSIAVLPFSDLSETHDQDYFADGMAEEIRTLLASLPELKVISRTSTFQFKGQARDVRQIASVLGVRYVVEGSVRRSRDQARISVQLVDARDGTQIWSQSYERVVGDVFRMQEDLAIGIARALQVSTGGAGFRARALPRNPAAYDAYLRGLLELDTITPDGVERAIDAFERSLALDPNFVSAAEALTVAHLIRADYGFTDDRAAFDKVRAAARLTLELDPRSGAAHAALGDASAMSDFDWDTAQREIKEALALGPPDLMVASLATKIAVLLGRWDEAVAAGRRATELGPLHSGAHQMLEYAYLGAGKLAEAEREARLILRIHPDFDGGQFELAQILMARGDGPQALDVAAREHNELMRHMGLAMAYATLGRRERSDAEMAEVRKLGESSDVAMVASVRGEHDLAFRLLRETLDRSPGRMELNIQWLKSNLAWQPLRTDPRFVELLRKLKLPA
jgi:TolB-like protein